MRSFCVNGSWQSSFLISRQRYPRHVWTQLFSQKHCNYRNLWFPSCVLLVVHVLYMDMKRHLPVNLVVSITHTIKNSYSSSLIQMPLKYLLNAYLFGGTQMIWFSFIRNMPTIPAFATVLLEMSSAGFSSFLNYIQIGDLSDSLIDVLLVSETF